MEPVENEALKDINAKVEYNKGLLEYQRGEESVNNRLISIAFEHFDKAYKHFHKAYQHYKGSDSIEEANCLHEKGMAFTKMGAFDTAIDQFNKSIKIKNDLKDYLGISNSLHQIGIVYQHKARNNPDFEDFKELELALEKYKKALKIREEHDFEAGCAESNFQIGVVSKEMGEQYYNYAKKSEASNKFKQAIPYLEFAYQYYTENKSPKFKKLCKKQINELNQYLPADLVIKEKKPQFKLFQYFRKRK